MNQRLVQYLACGLISAFAIAEARAVEPTADVVAAAAMQGPDRTERLVAMAKKEGALSLYVTMGQEQMSVIAAAYEKKYGIKVSLWRASSETVARRAITEAQGNRFEVDVIESNSPELESLYREQLVQPVKTPLAAAMIPEALPAHGAWLGARINVFVQAYNTEKVKREDIPRTYRDLADPKWKGKLAAETDNVDWFAAVVREMGEPQAVALFQDIVRTNGMSMRKGHPVLASMVAAGDVSLALSTYNYFIDKLRKDKGAPVAWTVLEPAIARVSGVALARRARHPHAAVLFVDFMLSEAQSLFPGLDLIPAVRGMSGLPQNVQWKFVDPAALLNESGKWTALYQYVFAAQGVR
jgi:iron(III) transport system substrate-binding protein